jgi:hypothetical protein
MNETNGQTCTTKIEECLYFGTERVRDRDIGCTRQDACRAVRKGIRLPTIYVAVAHHGVDGSSTAARNKGMASSGAGLACGWAENTADFT